MNIKIKVALIIILIIISSLLTYVIKTLLSLFQISNTEIFQYINYIQIGLYLILGIWLVNAISGEIRVKYKIKERSILASNIIKYLGYIVVLIITLSPLIHTNGTALIAGGTFSGLVIGLALQPILENFFAGLLILLTGYVRTGERIRIMSTSIPYLSAQFPAYKHFSTDFIEQGYKGIVMEIGLFYSIILLETGRELKISNATLMRASIIDYTPTYSEFNVINVRVEFPLNVIDITTIEDQVKEQLRDFNIIEGPYINEQIDKDHVIILVRLKVNGNDDWKRIKSEAIKRLLKLRQELIKQQQKIVNPT